MPPGRYLTWPTEKSAGLSGLIFVLHWMFIGESCFAFMGIGGFLFVSFFILNYLDSTHTSRHNY